MKNPLFQKCLLLALIGALLLIPLAMIEGTINERTAHRAEAIAAIAASSAGEQTVAGPVLSIPVIEDYDDEQITEVSGSQQKKITRCQRTHVLTVMPHDLHFDGGMAVEKRAYGLHETAVYELQAVLTGTFKTPGEDALPELGKNAKLTWGMPTVSLAVADPRGISGEPKILLDGVALAPQRGTDLDSDNAMRTGFHAAADNVDGEKAQSLPFRIDLRLTGTGAFDFLPVGDTTTAELRANWPHPSFGGKFLPRSHEIAQDGFVARWSTTSLAANTDASQINTESNGFKTRLIEPVDVYRQALRAVKYGILFIVLSFSAFFMFENLRSLPIHPIQYLLVGLAQAVFFLLLTSLSEHIAFASAYAAAAAASILLIGAYLATVLRGWRRGLGFSFALAILYAALYGILCSEENALLLGSILLFIALAGLMLGTRHIDWYQLGKRGSVETEHA